MAASYISASGPGGSAGPARRAGAAVPRRKPGARAAPTRPRCYCCCGHVIVVAVLLL